MIRKTEAVILRTQPMGDTSLLLHVYSRDSGRLSLIAKGARSPKSRPRLALLQPGQLLQVIYYHKPNRDLHTLSEFNLLHRPHYRLAHPARNLYALLACEIFSGCYKTEEEIGAEEPFHVLRDAMLLFDQESVSGFDAFSDFLLGLVVRLGLLPDTSDAEAALPLHFDPREGRFENPPFGGGEDPVVRYLYLRITLPGEQAAALALPKAHRKAFIRLMLNFIGHNVANFHPPRTLEVFEDVFS